ncbi:MAG: hypothetical protein K8T10_20535 [Candidatus Eremiobacteraeota bacterium]|nr:hypothetical protein [Candidatus Eremiobacteraeota bacterium]
MSHVHDTGHGLSRKMIAIDLTVDSRRVRYKLEGRIVSIKDSSDSS